jgi:hypothetical protein
MPICSATNEYHVLMNHTHLLRLCRHIPVIPILNVIVTTGLFALLELNVTYLVMELHQEKASAQNHHFQAAPAVHTPDGK